MKYFSAKYGMCVHKMHKTDNVEISPTHPGYQPLQLINGTHSYTNFCLTLLIRLVSVMLQNLPIMLFSNSIFSLRIMLIFMLPDINYADNFCRLW